MKVFIFFIFICTSLGAGEVCQKCERIREHNKENPGGEYEFYEDYLKSKGEVKEQPKQDSK